MLILLLIILILHSRIVVYPDVAISMNRGVCMKI